MRAKLKTISMYVISLILIVFYIGILIKGINTDANTEYKLYYVERVLQDWPGYGGLKYDLGVPIGFGIQEENVVKRRGKGWGNLEENACWTIGSNASLYFSEIPSGEPLMLSIELESMVPNVIAHIYANDSEVGIITGEIDSERMEYKILIPSDIVSASKELILEFKIDNPQYINGDKRLLGLMVRQICIDLI